MALGKEELLAAIAAAGTAGRTAYDQANQAIAAQQQEAVRAALASGVAGQAPAGAQAEISRIVSQPYQQRSAQITQNRATMDDWYARQSAMQGTFLDQSLALAEAQAAAALAGGGGGGSGGGGGGGGDDAPFDWYENLKDTFGTADLGFGGIQSEAEALGLTQYKNSGMAPYEATQQYAMSEYGVPQGVAMSKYKQSEDDMAIQGAAGGLVGGYSAGKYGMKELKSRLRKNNRANPGDQTYIRKAAVAQAKASPRRKPKKK
jgi:hypothetical protein